MSHRHRGLTIMKMLCHSLCSQRISTQPNTYKRFWTNLLDSVLHQHHPVPPVEFQRPEESVPRTRFVASSFVTHLYLCTLPVHYLFSLSMYIYYITAHQSPVILHKTCSIIPFHSVLFCSVLVIVVILFLSPTCMTFFPYVSGLG